MTLRLLLFMLLCFGFALSASAQVYFIDQPTVSPDGKTIVFTFDEDLWQIDAAGGEATRLTAMAGPESHPSFSPDGRWLAFTGQQDGNENIYLMNLAGGAIQQLTFHERNDRVDSWSWDSQAIYFTSHRENNFSVFQIPRNGGTPKRLIPGFFNTSHHAVEHPNNGTMIFTDSWESYVFQQRPSYKGSHNPNLKAWNFKTEEVTELTTYEGKDFHPTMDRNGALYYISESGSSGVLNLFQLKDGKPEKLTDFETSVRDPHVSASGNRIAFIKDFQLWTYSPSSGKTQKVDVRLPTSYTLDLEESLVVTGSVTNFDVSPDGKKLALSARGQLFVSDIKGKFVRQMHTPEKTRVLDVLWGADNKTLYTVTVKNGWRQLFKTAADGSSKGTWLTNAERHVYRPVFNKEHTQLAFLHGRDQLKLLDVAKDEATLLLEDEFWSGLLADQPQFSPDGTHLLFAVYRDMERDIQMIRISDRKITTITETGLTEGHAFWSGDQRTIFFAADRNIPFFPTGGNGLDLYKLDLQRVQPPLKSQKFEQLFKEESEEETEKKLAEVKVDTDELLSRWETVDDKSGFQVPVYVFADGEKQTVIYWTSNNAENPAAGELIKTTFAPFEDPKTETLTGVKMGYNLFGGSLPTTHQGDTLYVLANGRIFQTKTSATNLEPIKIEHRFFVKKQNEFQQMFYEMWANLDENFYDGDFHGQDWDALRRRYEEYLPHVRNRGDLRLLQNRMLGALNSSHLGFNSEGEEEEVHHGSVTANVGLQWASDAPFTVTEVIEGGPADYVNVDIQAGDLLVAVNDEPIKLLDNRERFFAFPELPEEIKLTFRRNQKNHEVWIKPAASAELVQSNYREWVRTRQAMADEKGQNKIAYIHMYRMTPGVLEDFMREITSEGQQRDALILDLRFNRGGNVHDAVIQMLSQRKYANWKFRDGKLASQPNFTPGDKPIALLINYQTLSDGEMTTSAFKAMKLGKVFGTSTYRWLIFTSALGLVDGSTHRMPSWGCYSIDGENLELEGVAPDEIVPETVSDRAKDRDPQLEAAIKWINEQL